ncbi:cysteine--tRNA ligase [Paenibacillus sp. J31TS4]|uniref:cysteine--tRNA ligase n=1 Tax=Paenibacillus sp. J31TS4 TaxID=2807195 RepID=UPI001B082225|nr:cysteine--tRNA ligase [Paenibacillus sp. J31TS4]GIP41518.1 cysteine--tRNA ligase [Paenibacillus sp. J31TS4]
MALKVYNTVTRTKETFQSQEPGRVTMYVCGPTVYDYIHIGNARPLIVFDVVKRYLTQQGYDVRYVVNFTDVDDKLIRKAEETGSTVPELAAKYIEAYLEDTRTLGVDGAIHPRVTENIPEIIVFIEELVAKGFAYESGGDVYFRTLKFPEYGKISHQNIEELQFGIRVEVDQRKEHPQDFVLWKAAKPGEISWPSPWGEGRPGWHIECSAMAKKYLGETIDIHGGGQDLQFPHHECEVAQSEALHGHPLANYWLHNGYLNINNEKMSKSLGNGLNVREILKTFRPEVIRYFMLAAHYRSPLNFSEETVRQAENSLERIQNSLANLEYRLKSAADLPEDEELEAALARIRDFFFAKMDDDFNTADAITAVFDLVAETNRYLKNAEVSRMSLERIQALFAEMNEILGIWSAKEEELLDEEVERLIAERTEARATKNWARADEIRQLLTDQGILLEDTPQGIRWRRK